MNEDEARALWRLRNRWLGAYGIAFLRGQWMAVRYGHRKILTAGTAEALGGLIQQDYDLLTVGGVRSDV
jgi:hypothetical protein